jgi:hypothetical protein
VCVHRYVSFAVRRQFCLPDSGKYLPLTAFGVVQLEPRLQHSFWIPLSALLLQNPVGKPWWSLHRLHHMHGIEACQRLACLVGPICQPNLLHACAGDSSALLVRMTVVGMPTPVACMCGPCRTRGQWGIQTLGRYGTSLVPYRHPPEGGV